MLTFKHIVLYISAAAHIGLHQNQENAFDHKEQNPYSAVPSFIAGYSSHQTVQVLFNWSIFYGGNILDQHANDFWGSPRRSLLQILNLRLSFPFKPFYSGVRVPTGL